MEIIVVRIRPARLSECAALTELAVRSKASWGYSSEFMASCRDELTVTPKDIGNDVLTVFVAEEGGQRVGFCALEKLSPEEFELDALFVEPKRMGSGIGKALMEHAISFTRQAGGLSILIQGDPNAAGFYERAGARPIGERESGSIPGRFLPEYWLLL